VGISNYTEKALLDWLFLGAAPTRPASVWVTWATATPTSQSPFEGPFTPLRIQATFAPANSPQGSATNLGSVINTATAANTPVGYNIYDSSAGGNRLAYGLLDAAVGCKSADTLSFAAGALKVTLA
jgi:hypothetical protein